MKYSAPMPLKEAMAFSQAKILLPTSMGTRDLARLKPDIRERSRFSAKVRQVRHLAVIDDGVNDLLEATTDRATARLAVKKFLQGTGYVAEEG